MGKQTKSDLSYYVHLLLPTHQWLRYPYIPFVLSQQFVTFETCGAPGLGLGHVTIIRVYIYGFTNGVVVVSVACGTFIL